MLNINDYPGIRRRIAGCSIIPVKLSCSAAQGKCVKAQELLITETKKGNQLKYFPVENGRIERFIGDQNHWGGFFDSVSLDFHSRP